MIKLIKAPFTEEQVHKLNLRQYDAMKHPYTCPLQGDAHYQEGVLVAYEDGWRCPHCGYRQDWCLGSDII